MKNAMIDLDDILESFFFIEKCLSSCNTIGQIESINKMITNFKKKYILIDSRNCNILEEILMLKVNIKKNDIDK